MARQQFESRILARRQVDDGAGVPDDARAGVDDERTGDDLGDWLRGRSPDERATRARSSVSAKGFAM